MNYIAMRLLNGLSGTDKSHGLDGFSMSFYQTYWDIIKSDLFSMFEIFLKAL
jgi:hypothetical protein